MLHTWHLSEPVTSERHCSHQEMQLAFHTCQSNPSTLEDALAYLCARLLQWLQAWRMPIRPPLRSGTARQCSVALW